MEYLAIIILAAAVFGLCFFVDKLFTRLFRSQSQHYSGKSVRLNKRYGSFGLIIAVFGVALLFASLQNGWVLLLCGILILALGVALVVYYMSFGVFYDDDSFILTTFGKKSKTYAYRDICTQQLYVTTGQQIVVELYMADGNTFQLQLAMENAGAFLDHAFAAWLRQTGRSQADCSFHDPANSCWFPTQEG